MKMNPINPSSQVFKSNNEWQIFGYDDSVSKEVRSNIRKEYEFRKFGLTDLYEQEPHLDEYSLNKLLNVFRHKPKKVDENLLTDFGLYWKKFDGFFSNSYRGETLYDKPQGFYKALKDAGIKTIIDTNGYGKEYKNKVESAGMNFLEFPIYSDFWKQYSNPVYFDLESQREFIDKLIKFIQVMQQDYVYIACEYGLYKTDDALILNSFFNPKAKKHPSLLRLSGQIDVIEKIYQCLNDSDKWRLGWNSEFDKQFHAMVNKAKTSTKFIRHF